PPPASLRRRYLPPCSAWWTDPGASEGRLAQADDLGVGPVALAAERDELGASLLPVGDLDEHDERLAVHGGAGEDLQGSGPGGHLGIVRELGLTGCEDRPVGQVHPDGPLVAGCDRLGHRFSPMMSEIWLRSTISRR